MVPTLLGFCKSKFNVLPSLHVQGVENKGDLVHAVESAVKEVFVGSIGSFATREGTKAVLNANGEPDQGSNGANASARFNIPPDFYW